MYVRRHISALLPAVLLSLGLMAAFVPARTVLAQEKCLDRNGNPAPCPDTERKKKPTPILPMPTTTPTATPTSTSTATPPPTRTPTAVVAALVPPGASDPAGAPSRPIFAVYLKSPNYLPGPTIMVPGLFLAALLLLLVLLALRVWSLQGVLKHEAPQSTDQPSSGKIPHKPFGIVDRSRPTADPDKAGRVKVKLPNLPDPSGKKPEVFFSGEHVDAGQPPPTSGEHEVGHWQGTMGTGGGAGGQSPAGGQAQQSDLSFLNQHAGAQGLPESEISATGILATPVGDSALGDNALGDNALGDNALGENALGDNALGDNALSDNALGDNALGDNSKPASSDSSDGDARARPAREDP